MTAGLPRVGAFTAACVLVSNAVGSGIFTTSGFLARDLGDPRLVLLLWGLGGLLSLAGAMSYGELGAAMPRVGGEYVYLRRAFGPLAGFLSGWTSFTIGFSAAVAAASVGFAHYLLAVWPASAPQPAPTLLALALVWGLTAVHARGVESGGRFQRFITIAKIGAIVAIVVAGFLTGRGSFAHVATPSAEVEPRFGAALVGLVFVLYSYSGWNAAAYIAGEIRDPARNLPLATIAGTLFIGALYLATNLVYFYALPVGALAAEPVLPVAEKAATALFGPSVSTLVSVVLCVSIAGSVSSMVWAGPRVYQAMAEDGAAPGLLGRVSRTSAPVPAILLQSGWITILLLAGTFEQLVVYSGVALALWSALAVGSVLVLRRREPDLERPYRVALHPWVPLTYVAASLLIAGYATLERPVASLLSIATVLAGAPLYWLFSRRRSTRRRPATGARGPGSSTRV